MDEYNYSTPRRGLTLIAIVILGFCAYRTETSRKDVKELSEQVCALNARVDSVMARNRAIASPQKSTATTTKAAATQTPASTSTKNATSDRISITTKAKVENRYLPNGAVLPRISHGPTGTVVINVTMNFLGKVNAVSVNSKSTIMDEEIIDACKEAALRTGFSSNTDAPSKQTGTITYTFQPK